MKTPEQDPPLLEVVKAGRSKRLKRMLSEGEDVNIRSPDDGASALHIAAIHGRDQMTSTLLNYGADRDALDASGETPLMKAVEVGQPKVVKILLAAGADADLLGSGRGLAALHFAAGAGHEDVTAALLMKVGAGKDIPVLDSEGDTPLMWPLAPGRLEAAKMLMDAGANLNIRSTDEGVTALHWAAGEGYVKLVSMLLENGAGKDIIDLEGYTPLSRAVVHGHLPVIEALLDFGVDVTIPNVRDRFTPLHIAAHFGWDDIASALLARGGVDTTNVNGETPLVSAVLGGHLPVVEALLHFGADVTIPTTPGRQTPLHHAASLGQGDIVSALLARGANTLVTDDFGETPLESAVLDGHERVYMLMAKGTALGDGKADGCFALRHAFDSGHDGVVSVLLQRANNGALECDGERPLIWAAARGYLPMVESLVAAGGNVNIRRSSDGCAALHLAAGGGHVGIASALLRAGAYKNVLDNKGRTPLLWATAEGHQPMVYGLIDAGADCDTRSKDEGFSALHLAAGKGYKEIVSTLLGGGADVDAVDHNGNTALMWAAGFGHDFVVEVLLAAGADVSIRNNVEANSALDWAAQGGHVASQDAIRRHLADAKANEDECNDVHLSARTDRVDATQVLIDEEFDFDPRGGKTKAVGSGSLAEGGGGRFGGMLAAPAPWLDVEGILLAVAVCLWFSARCRFPS